MAVAQNKELVSETIYRKLRSDIIIGRLKPGERLVELDIAKHYQSSQIPVREAFLRLEEQGLLRMIKHTGTFVSDISNDEMKELFEQRCIIEKNAVRRAMYLMGEEEKNQLKRFFNDMLQAAESRDLNALVQADMSFHQTIISASGRKISLQIWKLLDGQIRRFLMVSHPKYFTNLHEVARTHEPLLELILAGDAEQAAQCCEEHILLVWNKIQAKNPM